MLGPGRLGPGTPAHRPIGNAAGEVTTLLFSLGDAQGGGTHLRVAKYGGVKRETRVEGQGMEAGGGQEERGDGERKPVKLNRARS